MVNWCNRCDVSKKEEVEELYKKVKAEVGDVTILVNNAGIMYVKSIIDYSEEDILKMYKVNVFAHFWVIFWFLFNNIFKKIDCRHRSWSLKVPFNIFLVLAYTIISTRYAKKWQGPHCRACIRCRNDRRGLFNWILWH